MMKFTHEHDLFIAAYFSCVGADVISRNDLPFTPGQITRRHNYLLKNRPDVFEQVKNEERALEIVMHYNLSPSSVKSLISIYDGHASLGRGAGMSVKALKDRGFVCRDKLPYELTPLGADCAIAIKKGLRK